MECKRKVREKLKKENEKPTEIKIQLPASTSKAAAQEFPNLDHQLQKKQDKATDNAYASLMSNVPNS